jgi:hypothetical protein
MKAKRSKRIRKSCQKNEYSWFSFEYSEAISFDFSEALFRHHEPRQPHFNTTNTMLASSCLATYCTKTELLVLGVRKHAFCPWTSFCPWTLQFDSTNQRSSSSLTAFPIRLYPWVLTPWASTPESGSLNSRVFFCDGKMDGLQGLRIQRRTVRIEDRFRLD